MTVSSGNSKSLPSKTSLTISVDIPLPPPHSLFVTSSPIPAGHGQQHQKILQEHTQSWFRMGIRSPRRSSISTIIRSNSRLFSKNNQQMNNSNSPSLTNMIFPPPPQQFQLQQLPHLHPHQHNQQHRQQQQLQYQHNHMSITRELAFGGMLNDQEREKAVLSKRRKTYRHACLWRLLFAAIVVAIALAVFTLRWKQWQQARILRASWKASDIDNDEQGASI